MQISWLLCTTLLLQAADAPAASSPGSPSTEVAASTSAESLNAAQQIAPAILSSIRTNSERLQGAEFALTRTLIDSRVKQEETVEESLPNGGRIVTTRAPQLTFAERVVVLEDRLRVDQGGNGTTPPITYWFDGVRWTEANPAARRISKMHQNQIGGRVLDPREAAGLDHRTSLASILSQPALKNATLESVDSVKRIATTTTSGGQKLIVDFDSRYAMLPTRSQLFHENGALARDVEIKYAWMEPRTAWALEGVTERIYEEQANGVENPGSWKQQLITAATCTLLDQASAEKLLAPIEPAGYQVVDYTDPSTLQRKVSRKPVPVVNAESPLKWFIVAHVVLAALAAAYFWRRRFASTV
jgi:hypothetical protein